MHQRVAKSTLDSAFPFVYLKAGTNERIYTEPSGA